MPPYFPPSVRQSSEPVEELLPKGHAGHAANDRFAGVFAVVIKGANQVEIPRSAASGAYLAHQSSSSSSGSSGSVAHLHGRTIVVVTETLKLVAVARFELTASIFQGSCSTRLSYTTIQNLTLDGSRSKCGSWKSHWEKFHGPESHRDFEVMSLASYC